MVYCMILSAVCIALGLLCLLRPALVWKWTEQWKSYRADEPSELYRFGIRFGGRTVPRFRRCPSVSAAAFEMSAVRRGIPGCVQ